MAIWQSIDTAPKDGTVLLLHENGRVTMGWFDRDEKIWFDEFQGRHIEPSHWMALPEPPCAAPPQG